MYHDVFYLGKILFDGIMNSFCYAMGGAQSSAAVRTDFYIYVNLIAKDTGMQKVYTQHALLVQGALFQLLSTASLKIS